MNLSNSPTSHKNDPITSYKAADTANIKGQALQVYEALKRYPNRTARELSEASGIDYYIVQRRLSILRTNGLAKTIGERVCVFTNRECKVWDV